MDQNLYPWFTLEPNMKKYYYLPNAKKAYKVGFFKLEDTGEIFEVTGIISDILPTCLKFEKFEGEINKKEIPIAKVVNERFFLGKDN